MPIVKGKAALSYQSASKCQERLFKESLRNSKKAVLYKTCLEEEEGKISKTLERKLVRDVSKSPRTTAKSLVNDLAKSGFEVSDKTVTRALYRNGL